MDLKEFETFTADVPLFSNLTAQERMAIHSIMLQKTFSAGDVIVHEDDAENQTFFIIVSGSVHVTVLSSEGKQAILATLRSGAFFGEMAILDGEPRSASVVAAESCSLLMLYRKSFLQILQKCPKITVAMLLEMSHRLRRSNRQINSLSMMSVYGRVADVLLQLSKSNGRKVGSMVVVEQRPSHQTIADMAGTSRETVSRVLSQLQKKGYLTITRKRLVILNEEKLYY
jgi:CRP/FNR family transcriptional regulator/CRP/FNR family cyclic AMP-dependent transcriptional regulator